MEYKNGTLHLDGYNVMDIAREYGTPLYLYSANALKENYKRYEKAFSGIDHVICYAVKANSNSELLKILASMGAGADVVSGGELYLAMRAGIDPAKIVFSGVGKSRSEIEQAIDTGICFINIESEDELNAVGEIAAGKTDPVRISFRINPDIDAKTHPKISTGLKKSRFGIPAARMLEMYEKAAGMKNIEITGVHLHIGSQITDTGPFELAGEAAAGFVDSLDKKGIQIKYIDVGGGLGIPYENMDVPSPDDMFSVLEKYIIGRPQKLILEPGRSIVGNTGWLLTTINYIKKGAEKNFVIVDAGFNDFVRPAMYEAYHKIIPVETGGEKMVADIGGPVCESGDLMAADREVAGVKRGNVLAICDSGAYGFSMSSNYNSRLKPAEVVIDENGPRLIRRRETYEDLTTTEE
ncbi:MAG: diaminopimelate decarboxylase [Elusimicrobiota bacterium]